MSDSKGWNEPGNQENVEIKAFKGESGSKKNWVYETSIGKLNVKKSDLTNPMELESGKTYFMRWEFYCFKNDKGETIKMRIADGDWSPGTGEAKVSEKSQTKATETQKTTNPNEPRNYFEAERAIQQKAIGFGNKLNNAVALVVAQIDKGVVKPTNEEIELAIDKLFESFKRGEETGKFERPF